MRYILILRKLTKHEHSQVLEFQNQSEAVVITTSNQKNTYSNARIISQLTEKEKTNINYRILSEVLEFGDVFFDNKSFSERLTFHTAGLWYYHKFRIYFDLRNQQYEIEELNKNLIGATSAIIYTSKSGINPALLKVENLQIISDSKKDAPRLSIWSVIQYFFTASNRYLFSLSLKSKKNKNQRFLVIDSINQYRKMLALQGKSFIYENAYLGYLYQKKGEHFSFIDQLLIPKFRGPDKFKFQKRYLINHNKRNRLYGERIIISGIFSFGVLKQFFRTKKELQQFYSSFYNQFNDNSSQHRILERLKVLNNTSLFYLFKYYSYCRFFKHKNFKAVLTTDENSPNFKIILDAAKRHRIFTVGYQHGSIHELHPAYIYSQNDQKLNPVPDLTITWGKKWYDLLITRGNYLPENLAIAGQIRTDVIPRITENRITHRPSKSLKYTVMFATQPQRDQTLRYRAALDVVMAIKNIEDAHLIFKLHPRENDPYFYSQIADEQQFENYTIEGDQDLFLLLNSVDAVITCFSTVGTEALYFQKPLIILDHLKQDILKYCQDGVAFQASDSKELTQILKKVLNGELTIDPEKLKKYIIDSTFRIDGKTSERVWERLNSINHTPQ